MTAQDLFNTCAVHLLTQNEKSKDPSTLDCVYHGPRGLKCAAGVFIPDDRYTSSLEGYTVENERVQKALGVDVDVHRDLLRQLQHIHDIGAVYAWRARLHALAVSEQLSPAILDTVPIAEPR